MNLVVVDTSSWITYFSVSGAGAVQGQRAGAGQRALDEALQEGRVYLSPVVAAELMSGVRTTNKQEAAKREALADFLRDLPLCNADIEHWIRVGTLRSRLAAKGLSVSTPDAHIAQCAIDLEGYLLSEDRIFQHLARPCELRLL